jgi:hypothetical protein
MPTLNRKDAKNAKKNEIRGSFSNSPQRRGHRENLGRKWSPNIECGTLGIADALWNTPGASDIRVWLRKDFWSRFRRLATMEKHSISSNELKELIKEALISTLTERSDLLENAVSEAILDMKLGLAMEEGDTGEYIEEQHVISKLAD